jgi:hypothetical protein
MDSTTNTCFLICSTMRIHRAVSTWFRSHAIFIDKYHRIDWYTESEWARNVINDWKTAFDWSIVSRVDFRSNTFDWLTEQILIRRTMTNVYDICTHVFKWTTYEYDSRRTRNENIWRDVMSKERKRRVCNTSIRNNVCYFSFLFARIMYVVFIILIDIANGTSSNNNWK